jgi:acetylornithine deacetylase/succinyl-diaminopimelate desuccinylase-like protein
MILALTADEEGGADNGVSWLLEHHRDLINAEFALNPDAGGLNTEKGKPLSLGVEATEKLYADFRLTVTDPGGHSSLPKKENAIYRLAHALTKLEAYRFPAEINTVTRGYFEATAKTVSGQTANDMRAVLRTPLNPAVAARLSRQPLYNAMLRTTCVATMLNAGHAPNALPQRTEANINCRIFPGHSPAEISEKLTAVIADASVQVQLLDSAQQPSNAGLHDLSATPPPLNTEVFGALRSVVGQMWPNLPIIPEMETGASDSKYTMAAGIPSYGFCGMGIDEDDSRAHGRDERLGVESYYKGTEFQYRYLKTLTGGGN